jgi:hypothetical protein
MKLTRAIASMFTAVMLSGLVLSAPAFAAPQNADSFSALQGVDAQVLSVEEMQAISGELNALDIAAALQAAADRLDARGANRLADATRRLATFYFTNAPAINAAFMKLGIYTEPKP